MEEKKLEEVEIIDGPVIRSGFLREADLEPTEAEIISSEPSTMLEKGDTVMVGGKEMKILSVPQMVTDDHISKTAKAISKMMIPLTRKERGAWTDPVNHLEKRKAKRKAARNARKMTRQRRK